MASISKEESLIIDKMFSWCATDDELPIIKKSISDVKNGRGLYHEVSRCKGDLRSLKFVVSDYTGLGIKPSGELARVLWFIVQEPPQRQRQVKAGIVYGIWMYTPDICDYPSHAKLNGKKFTLKKGARIGLFKRVHPRQLVGCSCFNKPVLPF